MTGGNIGGAASDQAKRVAKSISRNLLAHCYEQGAQAYPDEACGVLSGPESEAAALDQAHPIENTLNRLHAEDPQRYPRTAAEGYVMAPQQLFNLERALRGEDRKIKVYYHSHVDVGAYFSEEDKKQALWAGEPLLPGVLYLVCGVKNRQPDGAILVYFDDSLRDFASIRIE